jgi:hypothetical protein
MGMISTVVTPLLSLPMRLTDGHKFHFRGAWGMLGP